MKKADQELMIFARDNDIVKPDKFGKKHSAPQEFLDKGWLIWQQSFYRITRKGEVALVAHLAKKTNKDVKELLKIRNGNPAYFLTSMKQHGLIGYTFIQAAMYLGYMNAAEQIWGYRKSCNDVYNKSFVVVDYMKIHCDGYKIYMKADNDQYEFYVDRSGLMLCIDLKMREFEMLLNQNSVEEVQVKYDPIFLWETKNTDVLCLNGDSINPEELTMLSTYGNKGSEE